METACACARAYSETPWPSLPKIQTQDWVNLSYTSFLIHVNWLHIPESWIETKYLPVSHFHKYARRNVHPFRHAVLVVTKAKLNLWCRQFVEYRQQQRSGVKYRHCLGPEYFPELRCLPWNLKHGGKWVNRRWQDKPVWCPAYLNLYTGIHQWQRLHLGIARQYGQNQDGLKACSVVKIDLIFLSSANQARHKWF